MDGVYAFQVMEAERGTARQLARYLVNALAAQMRKWGLARVTYLVGG